MTASESYFRVPPFPAFPSASRYIAVGSIEDALTRVSRSLETRDGISLVIGPPGTGKSLLAKAITQAYHDRRDVIVVGESPIDTPRAFYEHVLHHLKVDDRSRSETDLQLRLVDRVNGPGAAAGGLVIVVDEAQSLSGEVLEAIRMTTNIMRRDEPRVCAVLCGGPSLEDTLARPSMQPFVQRIATRCYLHPFNASETRKYITDSIAACGADPAETICDDALASVHHACNGVPRLINQMMTQAIDCAAASNQTLITSAIVDSAWASLQQLPSPMVDEPGFQKTSSEIEFGELEDLPTNASNTSNASNTAEFSTRHHDPVSTADAGESVQPLREVSECCEREACEATGQCDGESGREPSGGAARRAEVAEDTGIAADNRIAADIRVVGDAGGFVDAEGMEDAEPELDGDAEDLANEHLLAATRDQAGLADRAFWVDESSHGSAEVDLSDAPVCEFDFEDSSEPERVAEPVGESPVAAEPAADTASTPEPAEHVVGFDSLCIFDDLESLERLDSPERSTRPAHDSLETVSELVLGEFDNRHLPLWMPEMTAASVQSETSPGFSDPDDGYGECASAEANPAVVGASASDAPASMLPPPFGQAMPAGDPLPVELFGEFHEVVEVDAAATPGIASADGTGQPEQAMVQGIHDELAGMSSDLHSLNVFPGSEIPVAGRTDADTIRRDLGAAGARQPALWMTDSDDDDRPVADDRDILVIEEEVPAEPRPVSSQSRAVTVDDQDETVSVDFQAMLDRMRAIG